MRTYPSLSINSMRLASVPDSAPARDPGISTYSPRRGGGIALCSCNGCPEGIVVTPRFRICAVTAGDESTIYLGRMTNTMLYESKTCSGTALVRRLFWLEGLSGRAAFGTIMVSDADSSGARVCHREDMLIAIWISGTLASTQCRWLMSSTGTSINASADLCVSV